MLCSACNRRITRWQGRIFAGGEHNRLIGQHAIAKILSPVAQGAAQNQGDNDPHLDRQREGEAQSPDQNPEQYGFVQTPLSPLRQTFTAPVAMATKGPSMNEMRKLR